MKFYQLLNEYNYYGLAESLEKIGKEVEKRNKSKAAMSWAANEIRTMIRSFGSGSGTSVHDKLDNIQSLVAALKLYLDDEYENKEELKKLYKKSVEKMRAKR